MANIYMFYRNTMKRAIIMKWQRKEDIINMDLKEVSLKVWTGIGWLRMGSSGKFF
jgi:hypothetical protein